MAFADEYTVKFPEDLGREHNQLRRQAKNESPRRFATPRVSDALGIGEYIGVERDA